MYTSYSSLGNFLSRLMRSPLVVSFFLCCAFISPLHIQSNPIRPVKGKIDPSQRTVHPNLLDAQKDIWWADSYPSLFLDQLRHLSPPPTVVVLNQKAWVTPYRKSTILLDLPGAIRAALEVVDTVLWLQGAPTLPEAEHQKMGESVVDNLMRDVLCNSKNPGSIKVTKHGLTRTCMFVEFPKDSLKAIFQHPKRYYHDLYHFSDPDVYLKRNQAAMEAGGVKHHHTQPSHIIARANHLR
jgi:hypothetical protein